MRTSAIAMAVCCSIIGVSVAAEGQAAIRKHTHIPAQRLEEALQALAEQRDLQVICRADVVGELRTPGASGDLTVNETLTQLLSGTGLTYRYLNGSAITIVTTAAANPPAAAKPDGDSAARGDEQGGQKQSFWDRFRLAQVAQASSAPVAVSGSATEAAAMTVEEVVVTAQKRLERLQDVPVPVTAIDANVLIDSNQRRIQEYYTRIPGLSIATGDFHGAPLLAVRGVTTGGFSSPTVGVVIDDVPFGASFGVTLGNEAPDIDPTELARVELLRGPQGTFYGASSMGGLLKFVTVDPSTERFGGSVQLGASDVHNGDGVGHSVRGAVNIPLGDTLAVRASAFDRSDVGYVDNVTGDAGDAGVNQIDVQGGRLSALWRASETFSVKLSALLQSFEAHGSPEVHRLAGLGDLQQLALLGTGRYEKDVQAFSASVNAQFGRSDFASITGYNVSDLTGSVDYTRFRGAMAQAQYGVSGAALHNHFRTTKLTQELRLTTPIGDRVEWLVGAFYNREDTDPRQQNAMAVDSATGTIVGALFFDTTPNLYEEYAAFTDLTVHFTDRFDVQFGGRQSRNEQSTYQIRTLTAGGGFAIPQSETSESAFTYLVTPRLKISPDLMVYARLASGYRPGGPNPNALALGLPLAFDADKTQNFEVGVKGSMLESKLRFDASVYYIDWKDIQLQLVSSTGQGYFSNASRAKSQGVELSLEARPLPGLSIAGWVAYNDAVLTEDLPAASTARAFDGDRLPVSSRLSGSLSLEQEFQLTALATGYVGGTVSYVGDRLGVFSPATSQRQVFPSYAKTDLSTGVRYETWSFNLFVNNVADKRGLLSGGVGSIHPDAFTYIQPRTAGLSLSKTF